MHNAPPQFLQYHEKAPFFATGSASFNQVITTKRVAHIADLQVHDPNSPLAKYAGARTLLNVPLLKENELIGVIGIYRPDVRPFTDKQIELVQNFASQAVIAIENVRLFGAERQRTRELNGIAGTKTATAEVLRVISSSPGDLEPVFHPCWRRPSASAMPSLEISTAGTARPFTSPRRTTHRQPTPRSAGASPHYHPSPKIGVGRMVATKKAVHVVDAATEPAYIEKHPAYIAAVELGGVRTYLTVPMLKDNELIGAIIVFRQEVRPFTDKQIALVTNFAAQAVIAIENARLLNELRQRTADLTE